MNHQHSLRALKLFILFLTGSFLFVMNGFAGPASDISHRKGILVINTEPGAVVKIEQQRHEFWFGAAICNDAFEGNLSESDLKNYKSAFLGNFNSAVTENALKWQVMQADKDYVHYDVVDEILEWTDANNIPLRGHNIYWGVHQFVQDWVKELDDKQLHNALKERGKDIGSRYKGRFAHYDMNNEMIHKNYYADRLGEGITLEMANWVMEEDPNAQLYLNDYDILTGARLEEFLQHIRDLLDMGVPLAGIGVQGHLHTDTFDPKELQNALDELAKFGLPIVITEFNMPGQRSKYHKEKGKHVATEKIKKEFAKELDAYYRICFAHPAVEGILMWGFWAKQNWIPESSLFDANWKPTPLLDAYRNLVFKEWWTDTKVKANDKGQVRIPAFFGDYKVQVNGRTKKVTLSEEKGTVRVRLK